MKISIRSVLRVYWRHIRGHRWIFIGLTVTTIIANFAQITIPWFYKKMFDALTTSPDGMHAQTATYLFSILGMIALFQGIRWVAGRVYFLFSLLFQPRIMMDLEVSSFEYLIGHSYQFFTNAFAGSLVRRINRLSRAFEQIIDDSFWQLIPIVLTTAGILFVVYQRSSMVGNVILLWILSFLVFQYFFARWKLPYDAARAEQDSVVTGVLSDALTNHMNIKVFAQEKHEVSIVTRAADTLRRLRIKGWGYGEIGDAIQILFMIVLELAATAIAIRLWSEGKLTVGDFVLFQAYLLTIFERVWGIGRTIRRLFESFADASEMVEILETPHEIKDRRGAKSLKVTRGMIDFQHVSFGYHRRRMALDDFHVKIRPGEKVAFVGHSGAGKSTIVKCLFRFYDIDAGKIVIDGQDISRVTQASLRQQASLVPQEPVLFHRTLGENIAYGKPDATPGEIIEAAKKAHCHEFITALPQGYDTYVGERGIKLSGGERQRVAIARAILKNAPILILDEATSSLDSESEALIQDALRELMKQKTVLVIAHRLSTIMMMDRILVMEEGTIIDQGTHRALIAKPGVYKKLWDIQAGGFIP